MSNRSLKQNTKKLPMNQADFPQPPKAGKPRFQAGRQGSLQQSYSVNGSSQNSNAGRSSGMHEEPSNDDDMVLESMDLHLNLESLENGNYEDSESDPEEYDSPQAEDWGSSDEELLRLAEGREKLAEMDRVQLPPITNTSNGATAGPNQYNDGALVPIDDGTDVDSEEENEIMKEIKAEIQKQVREEMKSELDVYKYKMDKLERGEVMEGGSGRGEDHDSDLQDMEPKLREAYIKMRKLDRILSKKIKREKEVKRDRILLERRIKAEIDSLQTDGKEEGRDEKSNTEKYLALVLPPRHNEGVEVPESPAPDVFTTQLHEKDYPDLHKHQSSQGKQDGKSQRTGSTRANSTSGMNDSRADTASECGSEDTAASGKKGKKHKKNKKDFIKRNRELAKDAASEVAMTDEEKLRVEDLLKDLDQLPEILEEEQEESNNPFQITLHPGEGYYPDVEDLKSLERIDSRLKEILPPEEFQPIAGTSKNRVSEQAQKLFTPVAMRSVLDYEHYGERALVENLEQREMKAKLQRIEEELAKLHNPDEIEIETPTLQEDQLNDLLDQCARSLSRSTWTDSRISFRRADSRESHHSNDLSSRASEPTPDLHLQITQSEENTPHGSVDNTPRSPRSAREAMMENPPKLPDDVLQKLLSEAHFPLYGRLSTLREEEESIAESDTEDKMESITAETWKVISQEQSNVGEGNQVIQQSGTRDQVNHQSGIRDQVNNQSGLRDQVNSQSEYIPQRAIEITSYQNDSEILQSGNISGRSSRRSSLQSSFTEREANSRNQFSSRFIEESENIYMNKVLDGRESQIPTLPEINRSGSLVAQDQWNNQVESVRTPSVQSNRSVLTVRNSLSDPVSVGDGLEIMSVDGDFSSTASTPVPRPPSNDKHSSLNGKNKSRLTTPVSRTES